MEIAGASRTWKGWLTFDVLSLLLLYLNTSRFPSDISLHTPVNCCNEAPPEHSRACQVYYYYNTMLQI